jgi:prepilin-type N-terminal cleavage/methylation domain-containing protein
MRLLIADCRSRIAERDGRGLRSTRNQQSAIRKAFSLVELLVVIGIIALLVGILLPMIQRAFLQAQRKSQQADLQAIGTALEAYRQDFGDYPRDAGMPLGYNLGDLGVLGRSLIAPGSSIEPQTGSVWGEDGCPGPGFRIEPNGRKYGPYLPPDRFRTRVDYEYKNGQPIKVRYYILDRWENPIAYYPPWNPHARLIFEVGTRDSRWHPSDCNYTGNWATDPPKLRIMLGDDDLSGAIDGIERLRPEHPFLLASGGPDGKYGPSKDPDTNTYTPRMADRCDDVFNFDR